MSWMMEDIYLGTVHYAFALIEENQREVDECLCKVQDWPMPIFITELLHSAFAMPWQTSHRQCSLTFKSISVVTHLSKAHDSSWKLVEHCESHRKSSLAREGFGRRSQVCDGGQRAVAISSFHAVEEAARRRPGRDLASDHDRYKVRPGWGRCCLDRCSYHIRFVVVSRPSSAAY